jgi:hypothetical protein
MSVPPAGAGETGEYDQSQVEDISGPVSNLPLSRHTGEAFTLPSRISTIRGMCRQFDLNLNRYYVLPGQNHAYQLHKLLHNVEDVTEPDSTPKLYFGVITGSSHMGQKTPNNIRMTWLKCHSDVPDFCLKTKAKIQEEKQIVDETKDRVVVVWGKVTENGVGLCFENLNWGEFALLPEKYNGFLI